MRCDDRLHAVEPSLEGQLAFLQNRFASFRVLPLLTVGAVTGPVLAGWLVDQGSYAAAFGMGAGVLLLAGALAVRIPATRSSP